MKAVFDTCILKLATLPNLENKSALILEFCRRRLVQGFVTPDILVEYQRVLSGTPRFLAELQVYLLSIIHQHGH